MYTAIKEIGHLLTIRYLDPNLGNKPVKFALQVVLLIVLDPYFFIRTSSIMLGNHQSICEAAKSKFAI